MSVSKGIAGAQGPAGPAGTQGPAGPVGPIGALADGDVTGRVLAWDEATDEWQPVPGILATTGHGVRYTGSSTCWKDMIADLFGRQLSSPAGKVGYDWNDNAITFSRNGDINQSGDRVGGNQEINHEHQVGADILLYPHLHLWVEVATGVEQTATFLMRWRLQRNGQAKATTWTSLSVSTNDGKGIFDLSGVPNGTYNQVLQFDPITLPVVGISDTIQFQMTRTDNINQDIKVYFLDFHAAVDSSGSDQPYTKG